MQRRKEFTGSPEDLAKMKRIQDSATELVKNHLDLPYKEMLKTGCNDYEVACAFITLGYHILRESRSEKDAMHAFDALLYFGKQQLEEGRKRYMANKALKLH